MLAPLFNNLWQGKQGSAEYLQIGLAPFSISGRGTAEYTVFLDSVRTPFHSLAGGTGEYRVFLDSFNSLPMFNLWQGGNKGGI